MMLQGICLKVEFVEFVIQILKKVAKLVSEAEARRRRLGPERSEPTGLQPAAQGRLGGCGGAKPPRGTDRSLLGLGFHLYKYLCKPQEIIVSL